MTIFVHRYEMWERANTKHTDMHHQGGKQKNWSKCKKMDLEVISKPDHKSCGEFECCGLSQIQMLTNEVSLPAVLFRAVGPLMLPSSCCECVWAHVRACLNVSILLIVQLCLVSQQLYLLCGTKRLRLAVEQNNSSWYLCWGVRLRCGSLSPQIDADLLWSRATGIWMGADCAYKMSKQCKRVAYSAVLCTV